MMIDELNKYILYINNEDKRNELINSNPNDKELTNLKIMFQILNNQFNDEDSVSFINEHKNEQNIVGYFALGYQLGFTSKTYLMSLLFKSNSIERTGWVNNKLPLKHLESISEHMHHMWLIGMMYLPNTLDVPLYNKENILKMCLIHDLGETVTGDIPHPMKHQEDDQFEDSVVKAILLYFAYYNVMDALELFSLWDEWTKNETINAKIATDLDVVQLNNQLLEYALKFPDIFPISDLKLWFRRRPKLELTTNIFLDLIKSDEGKVELYNKIMN